MKKSPRPFSAFSYCKRRSGLKNLIQQAQQNTQLLNMVKSHLPNNIAVHCVAAEQQETILCLMVDSPTWSSKLRFTTTQLLKNLATDNYYFKQIKLKVHVDNTKRENETEKKPAKKYFVPPETAKSFVDLASVTSDPALKAVLLKLSKRVE